MLDPEAVRTHAEVRKTVRMTTLADITRLSVRHLLRLEASVVQELRRRELVRTNNKPLGDIAEHVVWLARGGVLEPNSTKSHDITTASGQRIQVKAMANRAAGAGARFSPFRSADYDTAVFLVFGAEFDIVEAIEVEAALIEERVRFVAHVAGRQPSLTQVRALGNDVTPEMQSAYERIDDQPLAGRDSAQSGKAGDGTGRAEVGRQRP